MKNPERITSPYAPDPGEVRTFLERMVRDGRFLELVRAVHAFVARVCEVNGELAKKLAYLRRKRPPCESLARLERQLALPLFAPGASALVASSKPTRTKKRRAGRHPGRAAPAAHLERCLVPNPVPPTMSILLRFHGVFAPNAKLRALVVPRPPAPLAGADAVTAKPKPRASSSSSRLDWAAAPKRVVCGDVLKCSRSGGRLVILAFIEKRSAAKATLDHLGLPAVPLPLAVARWPPQAARDF